MFTLKLKNNQTVEVPFDELEKFLEQNRDNIVIQQKEMGKRRSKIKLNKISSNKYSNIFALPIMQKAD
ncbi:hypothetical protein C7H19_09690 [Aphanothece hegewaldii CCALA 016]|uniref:Uncharacterized protein n=1 Tax=Aphanothece hegewaldii CCALA 016 TaxID=2107694 RepID=A0A2T1LYU3_9CHRO|nr:hypothetical protein C7H19_09690 [Aphanothece hegewaldii CCALA 016]